MVYVYSTTMWGDNSPPRYKPNLFGDWQEFGRISPPQLWGISPHLLCNQTPKLITRKGYRVNTLLTVNVSSSFFVSASRRLSSMNGSLATPWVQWDIEAQSFPQTSITMCKKEKWICKCSWPAMQGVYHSCLFQNLSKRKKYKTFRVAILLGKIKGE